MRTEKAVAPERWKRDEGKPKDGTIASSEGDLAYRKTHSSCPARPARALVPLPSMSVPHDARKSLINFVNTLQDTPERSAM